MRSATEIKNQLDYLRIAIEQAKTDTAREYLQSQFEILLWVNGRSWTEASNEAYGQDTTTQS